MRDKQGSQHIAALDGIRGLAVILVFVFHAASVNARQAPLTATQGPVAALFHAIAMRGWIGVDLFFVLSGFLITSILLRAKDAENYYQVFYARRALRILPLYYVVMFGLIAISPSRPPLRSQVWFWFNLSNFPTAFAPGLIPALSHYWSLAIEEQFYLLWPAMVRKFDEKVLIRICVGAIAGCLALRNLPIVLTWNQRWPDFIYRLTPFRIDTLCAGALLAILIHRGVSLNRLRVYLRTACLAGGAILAISLFAVKNSNLPFRIGYTGTVLCFAALIALALDPASLTAKIFKNAFLRRMGWYSYCFYLIHVEVLVHDRGFYRGFAWLHLTFANEELNHLLMNCVAFAVTFGICAASYKFFESPILDLKRFFPYKRRKLSELLPTTVS